MVEPTKDIHPFSFFSGPARDKLFLCRIGGHHSQTHKLEYEVINQDYGVIGRATSMKRRWAGDGFGKSKRFPHRAVAPDRRNHSHDAKVAIAHALDGHFKPLT